MTQQLIADWLYEINNASILFLKYFAYVSALLMSAEMLRLMWLLLKLYKFSPAAECVLPPDDEIAHSRRLSGIQHSVIRCVEVGVRP
ncbi:hypothetical protein TgHK011_009533 [Trichoderma gracile]|nr:hypothetical protein TgHK011_009533 [Trichoderma gracile]